MPDGAAPAPQTTDAQIGQRIRMHRIGLGLTQDSLAQALGLSYQQIQKYETGTNRVSASQLHRIAEHLGIEIASLFPEPTDGTSRLIAAPAAPSARHVIELVRCFSSIEDPRVRAGIMSLVRSVSGDDSDQTRQSASYERPEDA